MGKERTFYYRRVNWLTPNSHDLQKYVDLAHNKLNTTALRTFPHNEGQLQGINYKHNSKHKLSLLHITYYVPKQPTSLVPDPASVPASETVEKNPPLAHSYMEGDVFVLIKNNDLILCSSGAREGAAKKYIIEILNRCGIDEVFELEQVANVDKVAMLKKEGVKRIKLGSSLFRATYDHMQRKTKKTELMGKLAEEIMSIFGGEVLDNLDDLKAYDNLRVKLEISFDDRKKHGELAAQSLISAGCSMLDSEDEGFSIETKQGNKLTAEDIKVSKKVELNEHGNSVSCEHAWEEMHHYYEELDDTNVLEL
ncbi:MAG: hypothetical protein JEZ10_04155 [Verrucomicrobia bacterium]|nr:hypothetical protein [Verrucomicrobiota bacterium]